MSAAENVAHGRILTRWAGRFHAVAAVIRSAEGQWASSCQATRDDAAWLGEAGLYQLSAMDEIVADARELPAGPEHDLLLSAIHRLAVVRAQLYAAVEWIESEDETRREAAQYLFGEAHMAAQSMADQLDNFKHEQGPVCSRIQLAPCSEPKEASHV